MRERVKGVREDIHTIIIDRNSINTQKEATKLWINVSKLHMKDMSSRRIYLFILSEIYPIPSPHKARRTGVVEVRMPY